eukprot:comp17093_c0_seq1/m.15847 comp17093_c0_seq1/g.15847  ORF comp17093_c0_seq1/g.15847 comp17093_c0_seq1/m.15847 type:complete len:499 (-) comp17093_c0_seq1:68-1564(-)
MAFRPRTNRRPLWLVALATLVLFFGLQTVNGDPAQDCASNPESDDCEIAAIAKLHLELDSDQDGVINEKESQGYLKEHVENEKDRQKKEKSFRRYDTDVDDGNDYVSVSELQEAWKVSQVRGWSNKDVCRWVESKARMPKFVGVFRKKNISGKDLPSLALKKGQALKQWRVFSDSEAEQLANAIVLEVMFPSERGWDYKDGLLAACIAALPVCVWALVQMQTRSTTMDKELLAMRDQLKAAQNQLHSYINKADTKLDKGVVEGDLVSLGSNGSIGDPVAQSEKRLSLSAQLDTNEKVLAYEAELERLREELIKAYDTIDKMKTEMVPEKDLRQLLMLTYSKESVFVRERLSRAQDGHKDALEEVARVDKRNKSMLGALRIAHGTTMDSLSEKVASAQENLRETVTQYQEMEQRWEKIFAIVPPKRHAYKRSNTQPVPATSSGTSHHHRNMSNTSLHSLPSKLGVPAIPRNASSTGLSRIPSGCSLGHNDVSLKSTPSQ